MEKTPDWANDDPAVLRAWRNAQPDVICPVLPDDVTLVEVPVERGGGIECRPAGLSGGAVLHFHGGGFVVGSPNTHRCVGAWLAHIFKRTVWLCPYPLAPERTLPVQPLAAAEALKAAAAEYRGNIILSGDSAGSLMAMWAYANAEPGLRKTVRGVLLLYGYFGVVPVSGCEDTGLGPVSVHEMQQRLDPDNRMQGHTLFDPLSYEFPVHERVVAVGAQNDPLLANTLALVRAHPHIVYLQANGMDHGFMSSERQHDAMFTVLEEAVGRLG